MVEPLDIPTSPPLDPPKLGQLRRQTPWVVFDAGEDASRETLGVMRPVVGLDRACALNHR
jgi:hypothetical protein